MDYTRKSDSILYSPTKMFVLASKARKIIVSTPGVVFTSSTVHPDPWGNDQLRFDAPRCWHPLTVNASQWVQITLPSPILFVGFITQGRVCADTLQWTKFADVLYSPDGVNFIPLGSYALNTDATSPSTNVFQEPVMAKAVKICPTVYEGVGVLKVELLGFNLGDSLDVPKEN